MTPPDLALIAAELARDLHPIGGALIDAATHLAELSDLLPQRGDCREEFDAVAEIIAYVTTLHHLADERLIETAFLLQNAQNVPHPLPLHNAESAGRVDTVRATESGAQTPGIANVLRRRDPMAQHENTPAAASRVNP